MKLIYRMNEEDFKKHTLINSKSKNSFFSLLTCIVGFSILLILGITSHVPPVGYVIILVMTLVVYLLAFWFFERNTFIQTQKHICHMGKEFFQNDISIELFEDVMEFKNAIRDVKQPYRGIRSVREDKNYIIIEFKDDSSIYIPIINLQNTAGADKDMFISALKEKIS